MFDNILYPTDGSDGADAVIAYARTLAEMYEATVHLLFVVDAEHVESGMMVRRDDDGNWVTGMTRRSQETAGSGSMSRNPEMREILEREGEELTAEVSRSLAQDGIETITQVKYGDPAQVITDYASDNGIDLIVMGTHGRRGLRRRLIGSVTETVIRTTEVPVLTARLTESEAERTDR